MTEPCLHFERDSRSTRAMIGVAFYVVLLLSLWLVFDAVWWVLFVLGLPAIPALAQLWVNPHSSLTLDSVALNWTSGPREASVPLIDIDRVRMDTRWDMTVRITLELVDGSRLRLPPELTLLHRKLEDGLIHRGQKVTRRHFMVL